MSDPFASSRSKLAWAKEHLFTDLHQRVEGFHSLQPYTRVVEPDPKRPGYEIHKIKLVKPFPEEIRNVTGDLVNNLREVLDNAGHSIAIAANVPQTRSTAFPFARDVTQMAKSIGRAADLPKEIQSFFCGFQPYQGGDDLLWALNEMCVGNKHKYISPMCAVMKRFGASVHGHGRWFSMPDPHVWDTTKNEMEVLTLGPALTPDAKCDYQFDFRPFITINEIPVVKGQELVRLMAQLCLKVESILVAIEAEARRLKIVT
jgi:hypothetical protein